MTPELLGRYELLQKIGTGELGETFKSRSLGAAGFEKIVAVNRIFPKFSDDDAFSAELTEAAQEWATINHTNIVRLLEFGRSESVLYYAAEYVNGVNLQVIIDHYINSSEQMPLAVCLPIVHALCGALSYLNARAHLHPGNDQTNKKNAARESPPPLRPEDILVSTDGAVKLNNVFISPLGATHYPSAPQRDIHNLSALVYQCIGGAPEGEDRGIWQDSSETPVPAKLADILMRALHPDRGTSFLSVSDFTQSLEDFAHSARIPLTLSAISQAMRSIVDQPERYRDPLSVRPAPEKTQIVTVDQITANEAVEWDDGPTIIDPSLAPDHPAGGSSAAIAEMKTKAEQSAQIPPSSTSSGEVYSPNVASGEIGTGSSIDIVDDEYAHADLAAGRIEDVSSVIAALEIQETDAPTIDQHPRAEFGTIQKKTSSAKTSWRWLLLVALVLALISVVAIYLSMEPANHEQSERRERSLPMTASRFTSMVAPISR